MLVPAAEESGHDARPMHWPTRCTRLARACRNCAQRAGGPMSVRRPNGTGGGGDSDKPFRVCLLTGGGDAPGLNAAVRAFVHAADRKSMLVCASRFGFDGLIGREEIGPVHVHDVRGILGRGGSILGCSIRSSPFASEKESLRQEALGQLKRRLAGAGIDALVIAGGDGSIAIASYLAGEGVACVGIPKTIDGDLGATEQTCGNDSAVETATRAIASLHSTAEAHQRVLIVEVMGRHAGWIALRSGIAGGADVVLLPEEPYDCDRVLAKIRERDSYGLRFSIIVIGEGARPVGAPASEVERPPHGMLAPLAAAPQ